MDNTVAGIITEVSRQLNDQDTSIPNGLFVRWPAIDLLEYLNDGLIRVAVLKPDVTIGPTNMPVVPGVIQTLPADAKELISVDYALVNGCVDQVPLTRVDLGFAKSFYRNSCLAQPRYRPYNWAYEADNPSTYYLYPSVPGGVALTLLGTCRKDIPQFYSPNDTSPLPYHNKYHNAIVSWMQARAYEVDQESESSLKLSAQHRADFERIMQGIINTDQALHAGKLLPPGRRR